jgi:bloom syndrome protein
MRQKRIANEKERKSDTALIMDSSSNKNNSLADRKSLNSLWLKCSDDENDEQLGMDELINNVEEEKRIIAGKSNFNYNPSSSSFTPTSSVTESRFQPRINMKENSTSQGSSSSQNQMPFGYDEDGFELVDLSKLEDVIPSKSSTKQPSTTQTPAEKKKKDTLESIVPDQNTNATFVCTSVGNFHSNVKNDGITGEFDGMNYHFTEELKAAFKYVFGLHKFRQNQLQIINAALLGNDCFV